MRYVMLIHNQPEALVEWEALSREEKEADIARHREWFSKYGAEGRISGGEELAPPRLGRIVRKRGKRIVVTDGPFAESREVLGGFVVIDAPDMATVEGMAAEWPGLGRWNTVLEILPTDATTAD
jgi:hypothetical protein